MDVELADKVIGSLAETIKTTFRPEVLGKMGGFAALVRPDWTRYKDPLLVSGADGVWHQAEDRVPDGDSRHGGVSTWWP